MDAGDRAGHDGEVDGVGVLRCVGNRSPELAPAAVVVGRGRTRRSAANKNTAMCQ